MVKITSNIQLTFAVTLQVFFDVTLCRLVNIILTDGLKILVRLSWGSSRWKQTSNLHCK